MTQNRNSFRKVTALAIATLMLLAALLTGVTASAATLDYNIDKTRTGSLTIHKFEIPNGSFEEYGGVGEMSDLAHVPANATALADVEFKIKKVAELTDYFKPDGLDYPTPQAAASMTAIYSESKKTNAQGIINFTNLPLGIYYVEEGTGPAQITKKIEPFVVSLPMTNIDGNKWLYDIHCFPKNKTGYGDATVKKIDKSSGKALANAEYKLEECKTVGGTFTLKAEGLKTGANGTFQLSSLSNNTIYRLTETKAPSGEYIFVRNLSTLFYINAEGQMIINYNTAGGRVVGGKVVPNNTLVLENEKPGIHKSVLETPHGAEGIDTTQDIGKVVNWKIKTTIPSLKADLDVMKVYKITDTMSKGLSFKQAQIMLDDKKVLDKADYTETVNGMVVTFDIKPSALAGYKEVEVYFDTTLNSEAPIATDIPNTSSLEYSNTATSTHKIDSETPTVHTGGYRFKKVTSNGAPLAGVQFKIYNSEAEARADQNAIKTATANSDGIVEFLGLKYGGFSETTTDKATNGVDNGSRDYWINEIKTSEGYSLLKDPIKITIRKGSENVTNTIKTVENVEVPKIMTGGVAAGVAIASVSAGILAFAIVWFVKKAKKSSK